MGRGASEEDRRQTLSFVIISAVVGVVVMVMMVVTMVVVVIAPAPPQFWVWLSTMQTMSVESHCARAMGCTQNRYLVTYEGQVAIVLEQKFDSVFTYIMKDESLR